MAVGSIILGVIALICMVAGVFLSPVPYLGAVLSFGAPVMALIGIVMGGVSMSRAKQTGESSGAATAGLVTSIIAFILGLGVALTCGLCNACMTTNMNNPQFRTSGGLAGSGQLGAEFSRVSLSLTLATMPLGCATDTSGAANAQHFHPNAPATLHAESCQLADATIEAYGQSCGSAPPPCSSAAVVTPGSPESLKLTSMGIDPTQCFVYRAGQSSILACDNNGDFRIAHWENLNLVQ
ncbi:MAG: DUF4190 domain-containing protein [Myxococcota bacterium]